MTDALTDPASNVSDPLFEHYWQQRLKASWLEGEKARTAQHAPIVDNLLRTVPKPNLFNRRAAQVEQVVTTLVDLEVQESLSTWGSLFHVEDRTLNLKSLTEKNRDFRLTEEQRDRLLDLRQRWEDRSTQHFKQRPNADQSLVMAEQVRAYHEGVALRRAMDPSTDAEILAREQRRHNDDYEDYRKRVDHRLKNARNNS